MHLALILDGNRRWAKSRGLPKAIGHRRGVANLKQLLPVFVRHGVQTVSAYALSTENLTERSPAELANLFREIERFGSDLEDFHTHQIRVRIFGRLAKFPTSTRRVLAQLTRVTAGYTALTLNLCLGYGGRDEIVRAASSLARSGRRITAASLAGALDSAGQSDPDLLIRTGGKQRLSNFLTWQTAYSELYFTPKYWPEFDEAELIRALDWFAEQQRNFGK